MRRTTSRRSRPVRNVMTEGRMEGAVDFNIGGDVNIEMKTW